MEIKFNKWGYRFYFRLTCELHQVEDVTGVNSNLDELYLDQKKKELNPDCQHYLLWDFDNKPFHVVFASLKNAMDNWDLPSIHILSTGNNNYHAYCFHKCSWLEAQTIIVSTPNVDRHYKAAGCGRGYFTLRFTDLKKRPIKPSYVIPSAVKESVDPQLIKSFVGYTKIRG